MGMSGLPLCQNLASNIRPSARGELEITDVNRVYLERGPLAVELMGRGFAWLDTGTPDSLMEAADFVATLERQGFRISCSEEIAFSRGFIDRDELERLGVAAGKSAYGRYICDLAKACLTKGLVDHMHELPCQPVSV